MSLNRIRKLNESINSGFRFDQQKYTQSNNGINESRQLYQPSINRNSISNTNQRQSPSKYNPHQQHYQQSFTTQCALCMQLSKQNYQLKKKLLQNNQYQTNYKQTKSQLQALNQLYQLKCKQIDYHKNQNLLLLKQLQQLKKNQTKQTQSIVQYLDKLIKTNQS